MKITLIHYTSAPVIGGVEIVLAAHARLFAEHGHEVTILCQQGASDDARIRVELLPEEKTTHSLMRWLQPRLANQDVVFIHNVATMHFHLGLTEALWNLAAELSAVRFVAWVHDIVACNPDYQLTALDAPPWNLLRLAHPRFRYVAVSELRRRQFAELTGADALVIPNGIDPARGLGLTRRVAQLARAHGLFEREIVLLHPTRLLRRKNVELGLRVAAELKAAGRSCAYLITGPHDPHHAAARAYAEELRALRSELALEDVAFFLHDEAPLEEGDIASLFALSDALFFPSRQEGFGIPILEAALHRLPIFCAAIEPLTELLTNGITFFPLEADPAKIGSQITAQLSMNAAWQARRQILNRHSWPALYRNLLAPLLLASKTPDSP